MFSQPYILEQLLNHLAGASDKYIALGLAFALLGAAIFEALTVNVYFNMLFRWVEGFGLGLNQSLLPL